MEGGLGLFDSLKLLWFVLPQGFKFCVEFSSLFVALSRLRFEFFPNCPQLFQSPSLFLCPVVRFSLGALMCFFVGPEPRCRLFVSFALFFRSAAQRFDFCVERLFLLDQLSEVSLKLLLRRSLFTQGSRGFIESFLLFLLSHTERINLRTKGFFLCRALLRGSLSL